MNKAELIGTVPRFSAGATFKAAVSGKKAAKKK